MAEIYAPEVLGGTATFEFDPPDAAEMAKRLERLRSKGWPWLVIEAGGVLQGYAYASQFRDRPAYAATCETSVYVAAAMHRRGAGRTLLAALAGAARKCRFTEMIAVIGDGDTNTASLALHRACGFAEMGRLQDVGMKFGRRLSIVYMQRSL